MMQNKKIHEESDWVLPDSSGTEHRLSDYRGFWLCLYLRSSRHLTGRQWRELTAIEEEVTKSHGHIQFFSIIHGVSHRNEAVQSALDIEEPVLFDEHLQIKSIYQETPGLLSGWRKIIIINPDGDVDHIHKRSVAYQLTIKR